MSRGPPGRCGYLTVKLFYTGPVINAEMLVAMLEKHGIAATQAFADPAAPSAIFPLQISLCVAK